ncbi:MAG: 3-deoxy-7-phosphoheptulonate synthase [Opitutales bacterium]|nr:3-deoxy-7-phosphoheptulonate synthase [Opitutales bacterium]
MRQVSDVNVVNTSVLPAPEYLCGRIARTEAQAEYVAQSRKEINDIIFGDDKRILLVTGPCSIHDTVAGLEYARRLAELADKVRDRIVIVMRVYFEKPRTTVGWKGLIMDPDLDGSSDIPKGLSMARRFLRDVIDIGLPTATELLDPITPQYIADLICWSAVGARTSESQTHRQMASGLSMPLGFKNTTAGDVMAAINAIKAARQPQTFLGISFQGLASSISTSGNPSCHVILRGGDNGPNYDSTHVEAAKALLVKNGLLPAVMVDCSHANCHKDPTQMSKVLFDVVDQILNGHDCIIGAMLESNIVAGTQKFPQPLECLNWGQSITDPCIGWEETVAVVEEAYKRLAPRFA